MFEIQTGWLKLSHYEKLLRIQRADFNISLNKLNLVPVHFSRTSRSESSCLIKVLVFFINGPCRHSFCSLVDLCEYSNLWLQQLHPPESCQLCPRRPRGSSVSFSASKNNLLA